MLKGDILIVGIGNELRSDDGIGPELMKRLKGKITAQCLDVGLSPENYIGKIISFAPEVIVFVDAVDLGEPAGTIKVIAAGDIPLYGFSTHNMSPKLMIENIACQINVSMLMIGVQPKSVEFGEGLSAEAVSALATIEAVLVELLGKSK